MTWKKVKSKLRPNFMISHFYDGLCCSLAEFLREVLSEINIQMKCKTGILFREGVYVEVVNFAFLREMAKGTCNK